MSIRDNIRHMKPYTPGEQPRFEGMVKLNTNENPYPPHPAVIEALRSIRGEELLLYPDPNAEPLRSAIAEYHGLDASSVFVGVGSDDVLAMCFMTLLQGEEALLLPDLSYSFYPIWADLFSVRTETIALREDFTIPVEEFRRPSQAVLFPNPNAPTGLLLPLSGIEELLCQNKDRLVLVDEAYIDFAEEGSSAVSLLSGYENLLVLRTFSKSRAMAGMRIGYALGAPYLIEALNHAKHSYNSYTMNLPAIRGGCASLKEEAYFREQLSKVRATRERFTSSLRALGFRVLPSESNFVFASPPDGDGAGFYAALREKKIFVRYFTSDERLLPFVRISIGTDEEMTLLLKEAESFVRVQNNQGV